MKYKELLIGINTTHKDEFIYLFTAAFNIQNFVTMIFHQIAVHFDFFIYLVAFLGATFGSFL